MRWRAAPATRHVYAKTPDGFRRIECGLSRRTGTAYAFLAPFRVAWDGGRDIHLLRDAPRRTATGLPNEAATRQLGRLGIGDSFSESRGVVRNGEAESLPLPILPQPARRALDKGNFSEQEVDRRASAYLASQTAITVTLQDQAKAATTPECIRLLPQPRSRRLGRHIAPKLPTILRQQAIAYCPA